MHTDWEPLERWHILCILVILSLEFYLLLILKYILSHVSDNPLILKSVVGLFDTETVNFLFDWVGLLNLVNLGLIYFLFLFNLDLDYGSLLVNFQ